MLFRSRSLISSPYYRLSVIRMAGADEPSRAPLGLWTFNTKEQLSQFATGCDGDIGGTSTVHLDLDESSAVASTSETTLTPPRPTAKFWGEMKLAARPGFEGRVRGGYAGFRSKVSAQWFVILNPVMKES